MIKSSEQYYFWSIIHAAVLALPGIILESLLLKKMLRGLEIDAKLLDEGFESGRIQQVGHGIRVGFNFLRGYDEHGRRLLWLFVRSQGGTKQRM